MRTRLATFGLGLFLLGCAHPHPMIIPQAAPPFPPGVTVLGIGKASAPPDIARTSVGVEVRAVTAEEATSDATARMNAVVQALKQAGVADRDLRTQNLSIAFEQERQPPAPVVQAPAARGAQAQAAAPPAQPRGFFRVSNMVQLTIRDLNAIGRVLKAATDAGANSAWGINFELENDDALTSQARAKAVEQAKRAATELSALTGVKLGRIVAVSEEGVESPLYNASGGGMMAMRASDAEMPVERGEITQTYSIQVTYSTKVGHRHHRH
jgi:uncharacterized protein